MRSRSLPALFVVALAACGGGDEPRPPAASAPPPPASDPGPVHVHGLGENPKDGALFVATHTGLFRLEGPDARPQRIADRYQDTMGFTVVGRNRFLGSGHPDGRDGLPPFLGLITSADAGQTWSAVSLQGKADFHLLEASGEVVYGSGSDWETRTEQFLVSTDGGKRWARRQPPASLVSLVVDPGDAQSVVASGENATYASGDAGGGWHTLDQRPGLLSWPSRDRLYRVDARGRAYVSGNSGRTWSKVGSAGGAPAAFEATGPQELYVALHDGVIKRSADGGESWRVFYRPA